MSVKYSRPMNPAEIVTNELNEVATGQLSALEEFPEVIQPFSYSSNGDQWSVTFLGWQILDDETHGNLGILEVKAKAIKAAGAIMGAVRLIDFSKVE